MEISEQELICLSLKNLKILLKEKQIPRERQKEIMYERRALKNRSYAAQTRKTLDDEEADLKSKNEHLRLKIKEMQEKSARLKKEQLNLKKKLGEINQKCITMGHEEEEMQK